MAGEDYSNYRSPEEIKFSDERDAYVKGVLENAVRNSGFLLAAIEMNEPQEVIDKWTDKLWDELREQLTDHTEWVNITINNGSKVVRVPHEDRLTAIVLLITEQANQQAQRLIHAEDFFDPRSSD